MEGFDLGDLDNETLNAIMQGQLEDLQELLSTDKGKGKASDDAMDLDAVIGACQSELSAFNQTVSDGAMCRSIVRASVG